MNHQTESIALPASATHPDASGASWVRLRQRLLRHARMMVFEPAQAEDLVQESLVAVLEKPEAHRGEASLMTWAVAILKHKIADWYRSPHQRRRAWVEIDENEVDVDSTEDLYDEQGSYKEAVPSWQQPERQETQRQMMSVMEGCLKRLPSQAGRVFMMREWLGFETSEICERLSLSAENCRMILHRARMGLRQCMTTQGHTTGSLQ
ncbi:sigma-70 family RNA polymerase sigma factor [Rhodoferax sp.]|uniref:sigma-70 family RNA polymerase sigma factor n=1 Tax=Rhodoferax sp. TaxID=50421 RepID=UPI002616CF4F|nr:sigma-70 family RNA polymerase sigma factor [Rhodoferax sp.]MDD2919505.1 sigma-70 family RNA polymerase sigma factor [Rhodoferax sp.]